jgi:hypothetical protein
MVTNDRHSDGMYGNFAGRDASRGMAKQSFDDGEQIRMNAQDVTD